MENKLEIEEAMKKGGRKKLKGKTIWGLPITVSTCPVGSRYRFKNTSYNEEKLKGETP